jgi:hypothetical protein
MKVVFVVLNKTEKQKNLREFKRRKYLEQRQWVEFVWTGGLEVLVTVVSASRLCIETK